MISCKTIIGYGSPNKSGKASSHGSPLGDEEIALVRKKLKWNNKPFEIPQEILNEWKKIGEKGELLEKKWRAVVDKKNPQLRKELEKIFKFLVKKKILTILLEKPSKVAIKSQRNIKLINA